MKYTKNRVIFSKHLLSTFKKKTVHLKRGYFQCNTANISNTTLDVISITCLIQHFFLLKSSNLRDCSVFVSVLYKYIEYLKKKLFYLIILSFYPLKKIFLDETLIYIYIHN